MQHTFTRDERDELADTLLHTLLRFLCNLRVFRQRCLHNSRNWSKVMYVSIGINARFRAFGALLWLRRRRLRG